MKSSMLLQRLGLRIEHTLVNVYVDLVVFARIVGTS